MKSLTMKILVVFHLLSCLLGASSCESEEVNPDAEPDPATPVETRDSTNAIYRQFFFTGTHNSYSGNQNGMKREGIKTQLAKGLRFFEFDMFSFYTEELLSTETTSNLKHLTLEHSEKAYLFSLDKTNGLVSIKDIATGQQVYENASALWTAGEAEVVAYNFQGRTYLVVYYSQSGELIAYDFSGNGLNLVKQQRLTPSDSELKLFSLQNQLHISLHNQDDQTVSLYPFSTQGAEPLIGNRKLIIDGVSADITVTPFVQNEQLHLFKHNQKYVSSFGITSVETSTSTWVQKGEINGNSSKLVGKVNAIYSGEKLFLNTYLASGQMNSFQLILDNGKPNVVEEYNGEIDFLAGANVELFAAKGGFYAQLKQSNKMQLAKLNIGDLALGHDAPGDEVDLTVDNPNSILLKDWISYMANWSDENPNHEPLFIMTELKEYEHWMADAKWQNIIKLMQEQFGEKLRYHSSSGFYNEELVEASKIVDGKTLYYMDENGSKEGGLLGKVILYIQPNNNITKSDHTNDFKPFNTTDGILQSNFIQLKNYRVNNKLVSPDWRKPGNYGNDVGRFIDAKDDSYISRIFHMQSADGNSQYANIRCTDVMFAVSDRPFDSGSYANYVKEQKAKNSMQPLVGCSK